MNNQKIKHLMLSCSLVLSSLLTACDNTDYKTRIQKENDRNNPTGNKAICLRVGKIFNDMYPYTIKYMAGYDKDMDYKDPIYINHKLNHRLALYAKEGLFTEELVGYDGDKPLYRYDLTDEGLKYVDWWGGTNFCFGKVVVEKILEVDNQWKDMPMVIFNYHMENVPNWLKNKDIYSLYEGNGAVQSAGEGKSLLTGIHYFSKKSDGTLRLRMGVSGHYVL